MLRIPLPVYFTLLVLLITNAPVINAQSFLQINSSRTSDIYQVTALANNDLIIRGTFKGSAQFGSFSKTSEKNKAYVARVSSGGKFLWVTDLDVVISDVVVTAKDICVLSILKDKDKEAKTSSAKMILTKIDLAGKKLSEKSICTFSGSYYDPYLQGVLDNKGQPLACLSWVGKDGVKINGESLTKKKRGAICYVQYDQDGKEKWRQFTEGGQDDFTDMHLDVMTFDKDNNFHVIGEFGKEAIFGTTKMTTDLVFAKGTGGVDLYFKSSFLMKITPEGKLDRIEEISKYQAEYTSLVFLENGDMIVGGYYKGDQKDKNAPAPFIGGKELPTASSSSGVSFVARINSDWKGLWTYTMESERENRVESMSVSNDRLIVTGWWKMNLSDGENNFKAVETTFPYKSEVYQQVFDLDGKRLKTIVYQGQGSEWPNHILNESKQIVTFGCFRKEIIIGTSKFTSKSNYQNAFIIIPKKLSSVNSINDANAATTPKDTETVADSPPEAPSDGSYTSGQRVLANWQNKGKFYSCVISKINGNKISLKYDDGYTETTSTNFLKQWNWDVGASVECNWKAKGTYYKCTIKAVTKTQFQVLYSDGQAEWTSGKYLRSN
ncbi:MAG: hypothetical protein ACI9J3_001241 [Parvicellaceae bacterium]|jgi:hypothetical protein